MNISIDVKQPIPTELFMEKIKPQLNGATIISTCLNVGQISVTLSIKAGDESFRQIAEALAEIEAYYN